MRQNKLKNPNMEIGDYFDIGWNVFSENLKTFIIFVLVVNLPLAIVGLFVPQPEQGDDFSVIFAGGTGFVYIVFLLVSLVLAILANLATPLVAERAVCDRPIDAKAALQAAAPKIGTAIGVAVLASLGIGLGFVLLLVPGLYLSVLWAFITQAIILRNCGLNAFSYSRNLVKGQWGKVFWRSFVIGIAFFLLIIAVSVALGFVTAIFSALPTLRIAMEIFSDLVLALLSYLVSVVYTMLFLNLDYVRNG